MSSPRFHVNDYYEVKICSAKSTASCPYGENPHYDNYEEGVETAEKYLSELYGEENNSLSKKKNSFRELYDRVVPYELKREGIRQDSILRKARKSGRRLSPTEFEQHEEYVEQITSLLRAHGGETTTLYKKNNILDEKRVEQGKKLIKEILEEAKDVPNDKKALFAGGMGGAGKTSTMTQFGVADQNDYLTINPDNFKQLMAEKGMIPKVPGLLPMEASTLVHDEASQLSYILLTEALSKDKNVFLDVTMASAKNTLLDIKTCNSKNYDIQAFFVDVTPEISKTRARDRYKDAMDDYLMHGIGHGGRPIPRFFANHQSKTSSKFNSVNAEVFAFYANLRLFSKVPRIFDNSVSGRPPKEINIYDFIEKDKKLDFKVRL